MQRASDLHDAELYAHAAGPFEKAVTIGSTLVLVFGIATMWAEHLPLWGEGTRWVTISLIVYLSGVPFIPLVFLPRGRVFERAARVGRVGGPDAGAGCRVRRRRGPLRADLREGRRRGRDRPDGHEAVLSHSIGSSP